MPKASAETRTERLARYQRKAQERRDKATDGLDQKSRRHFTVSAEYYAC